jgi:hypothetical protein
MLNTLVSFLKHQRKWKNNVQSMFNFTSNW